LIFPQISPVSEPVVFFRTLAYAITMLVQIFLPCYFGNELSSASEKISMSLFHSCWLLKDVDYKKSEIQGQCHIQTKQAPQRFKENPSKIAVKIFMENSKKPLNIKAAGLMDMNYESFKSICNFAYSLYAVFKKEN
jgi:hypothetical protein